ncbi:hypothetical protein ACL02S_08190 [Nocardia sp. 004]
MTLRRSQAESNFPAADLRDRLYTDAGAESGRPPHVDADAERT